MSASIMLIFRILSTIFQAPAMRHGIYERLY